MLPLSPMRPRRRAFPITVGFLSIVAVACSDPSAPLAPRIGGAAHPDLALALVVTNTNDAGPGSLRQTIADAPDGTVIQFAPAIAGQTIVVTTEVLSVNKPLTIEGPTPQGITVSGGLKHSVFSTGTEVTIRNLSIVNGRGDNGGIYASGRLTLENSLLANNEGTISGGGIQFDGDHLALINTTVTGNVGGGVAVNAAGVTIRNSTIAGNSGGGLLLWGAAAVLRNSIVANNTDNGSSPPRTNCYMAGSSSMTFIGANVSSDDSCGSDPALIVADPKLGPLANNGGPTRTLALLLGSPAVDAGSLCTETTDQRYVTRDKGISCDLGAFEFENFAPLGLTVGPNVAANPKTAEVTVSGTVTCIVPTTVALDVSLSQTQRVKGRFSTIVEATATTKVTCTGSSSWTVLLTPAAGQFEVGDAAAMASTATVTGGFLPATAAASVKVFVAK
jgi:hypothetical protein